MRATIVYFIPKCQVCHLIYHIADSQSVEQANHAGHYRCASLDGEGFIHCCGVEQLAGVIERYYAGVDDLLLLTVDPGCLDAELVYENTVGGEELFPHVYGPINMNAVLSIEPLSDALQKLKITDDTKPENSELDQASTDK